MYGELLAPYLDDPSNAFVFSSDFCHWGRRFTYTFYDESQVLKSFFHCCLGVVPLLSQLFYCWFHMRTHGYYDVLCHKATRWWWLHYLRYWPMRL